MQLISWRTVRRILIWQLAFVAGPMCSGQDAHTNSLDAVRGTWTVKSIYPTQNVQGPSPSQQRKLLRSHISISNASLKVCGHSVAITSVDVHQVSANDFLSDNRVPLEEVGIHTPSVTEIVINKRQSGTCFQAFPLPGQDLYIKDKGELVIAFEGVFYRAVKDRPTNR
jgi:hypothetical protein